METSCGKSRWGETARNALGWREVGLFSEDLTKSIRLLEGWAEPIAPSEGAWPAEGGGDAGSRTGWLCPEPTAPCTLQDGGRGERLVLLRLPVLKIFISQAGQIVSIAGSRPLLVCFALSRS